MGGGGGGARRGRRQYPPYPVAIDQTAARRPGLTDRRRENYMYDYCKQFDGAFTESGFRTWPCGDVSTWRRFRIQSAHTHQGTKAGTTLKSQVRVGTFYELNYIPPSSPKCQAHCCAFLARVVFVDLRLGCKDACGSDVRLPFVPCPTFARSTPSR